jgi:hypothetical protein
MVLLVSLISFTNNLQQSGAFRRPPTIRYSFLRKSVFIEHAVAVKLQLQFPKDRCVFSLPKTLHSKSA